MVSRSDPDVPSITKIAAKALDHFVATIYVSPVQAFGRSYHAVNTESVVPRYSHSRVASLLARSEFQCGYVEAPSTGFNDAFIGGLILVIGCTGQMDRDRPGGDELGIILVNWNGWRDTVECVQSVLPGLASAPGRRLVIVDNASSDDSVAQLGKWLAGVTCCSSGLVDLDSANLDLPQICLVQAPHNGGFAFGNNIGLRLLLRNSQCEFLWLLNNDTVIEPDAVDQLLTFARQHQSAGLIGSTIVEYRNRSRIQCAGGARYIELVTLNCPALAGVNPARTTRNYVPKLSYISGAAMLMRRSMIESVGLLNEMLFLFYEELDYARRAKARGYELAWCRDSVIFHKGGASTGGISSRNKSSLSEYHANWSCLHYSMQLPVTTFVVAAASRFTLKILHYVRTRQWHLFAPLARAYVDFASGRRR